MTFKNFILDSDHPKDECGVFGIFDCENAATYSALGLHTLQHRGQESCGIITWDGTKFHKHRRPSLVSEAFPLTDVSEPGVLPGRTAIGHVRYSTTGGSEDEGNIQPFLTTTSIGDIAVSHNGNLTNSIFVRNKLIEKGHLFQTSSDTEIILHLVAIDKADTFKDRILNALKKIEGAYSLAFMTNNCLMGIRDPAGMRPLVLGKVNNSYVLASETCALDLIGASYERDIKPGELVVISNEGIQSYFIERQVPKRFCIFEYIYFMRPNSRFGGYDVSEIRETMGRQLAIESPVEADVVVPVPDSGINAALGYSLESQIPYKQGIIRSHFVGRTFIQPTGKTRSLGTRLKLSANKAAVENKKVVLIDDSIVRGTTMPKIVEMLRKAGAKEVHVRICSPAFTNPCFYGIDTPVRKELIANQYNLDDLNAIIKSDSLAYLSIDGLYRSVNLEGRENNNRSFCDACFTGEYDIPLIDLNFKEEAYQ